MAKETSNSKQEYEAPSDAAIATELARNSYARERHYFLMRIIMGLSAYSILSLIIIAILAHRPPEYRYFSTGCDGRIKELVSLNQPVGSIDDLTNWVSNSVTQAYTFDFQNYRDSFMRAKKNFTVDGWDSFYKGLQSAKLLDSVIANQYVATAVENGTTTLISQGLNSEGVYSWNFQMPMIVTYQHGSKNVSQNLLVSIVVVRENQLKNPRGIGIAQITAQ